MDSFIIKLTLLGLCECQWPNLCEDQDMELRSPSINAPSHLFLYSILTNNLDLAILLWHLDTLKV